MATTNPRGIRHALAGKGLDPGTGQTLVVDLSEFDVKAAPVMADSFALIDSEDASASKRATLTNTLKILGETAAGDKTTSGLTETDGVMRINVGQLTANTAPATSDKVLIEVSGVNKSVTIANAIKAIGEAMINAAGATAGIVETDGVIKIDIGNTTATVAPAVGDKLMIEVGGVNKSTTITNLVKAVGEAIVNAAGTTCGLSESDGVMRINVGGITATAAPVPADLMLVEVGGVNKSASITNLQKAFGEVAAGSAAATGLTEVDGVLTVAPTDEALVPGTGYLLTQNAAGEPHKDKAEDIVALAAGTAATSGLTAASGVLKVAPTDEQAVLADGSLVTVNAAGVPHKDRIQDIAELMAGTVATTGIENTAGVLSVVPMSLTAKTTPLVADGLLIGDSAAPTLAKVTTVTELMEVVAGTVATTGIENTTGVLSVVPCSLTAKTTPVVADVFCMGDSAAPTLAKKTTISELMAVIAGSGLRADAGILSTNALAVVAVGSIKFGAAADCTSITIGGKTFTYDATAPDNTVGDWGPYGANGSATATALAAGINGDLRNAAGPWFVATANTDTVHVYALTGGVPADAVISKTGGTDAVVCENLAGGVAAANKRFTMLKHVVTAMDVDTAVLIDIPLPFAPAFYQAFITNSGGVSRPTVTDVFSVGTVPNRIVLTEGGATHVIATDIIIIYAHE